MNPDQLCSYEFGPFRLIPSERLLLRESTPVPLTGKAFEALLLLVEKHGHLVDKSEMMAAVWHDAFVEDANVTVTVWMLRKALGDSRNRSTYIETVAKRGYRFVANVRTIDASLSAIPAIPIANLELPVPADSKSESWLKYILKPEFVSLLLLATSLGIGIVLSGIHNRSATQGRSVTLTTDISQTGVRRAAPISGTRDWEAYRLYLEGRYFWNKRTQEALRQSIERYQEAVMRDPQYAEAYAGLADSYTLLASFGAEPAQEAYPDAKAAALKALQLDESLAGAHSSLGVLSFNYEWNLPSAEEEFQAAIKLDPSDPMAHINYAGVLAAMGRLSPALDEALKAQKLAPVSPTINTILGRVYYWQRNYDKAISTFRYVLELDPSYSRTHTRLGMVYLARGNYSAAIYEFQEGRRLSGGDPYVDGLLGYAEGLNQNKKTALRMLQDLTDRSHREYVPAFSIAFIYLGLGDRDEALEWLGNAYHDHSEYLVYSTVDPLFDPIRTDPHFHSLLSRMSAIQGSFQSENN